MACAIGPVHRFRGAGCRGQQVVGRFDYDKNDQITAVERDKAAVDDAKTQKFIHEKYGLTVEQAKKRIEEYYLHAGLPPGAVQRDEAPRLDPNKTKNSNE